MSSSAIFDKVMEKLFALMLIGFGATFLYAALHDFIESHSRPKEYSEAEKADISLIQHSQDQVAMTEVVNRLMARPDIARVHVLKGDYEYPDFEVKRGKNARPADIGRHVNFNEMNGGLQIYIGYTEKPSQAADVEARQFRDSMKTIGCSVGGFAFIIMGLWTLFFSPKRAKSSGELPQTPPPLSSEPPPRTPPEPDKSDAVRFERLKLVKGGD